MMFAALPLLAQDVVHATFQWGRIQSNTDWILPVVALIGLMFFVRWMYRRDAVELPFGIGWVLTFLRTLVLFGLFLLYLQPEWRIEREVVRNSRAIVLVDTSLSMALTDTQTENAQPAPSRAEQVASALRRPEWLDRLRETHDVAVFRFDKDVQPVASLRKRQPGSPADDGTTREKEDNDPLDWIDTLAPSGAETRLGQALHQILHDHRSEPVAGVVVMTDGGQNAGMAPEAAALEAIEARIPLFPVGLGSDTRPTNVRVGDLVAPARVFSGDDYTVTGFIQGEGLAGRTITVELLSREANHGADNTGAGTLVESQDITLGESGEVVGVKFELTPESPGRRTLCLRVKALSTDRNPADDFREADVEIVDHKNCVLLFAGGPTREYRFLRTLLFRDSSTTLDVLLQTAQPGISQEADTLLDAFPLSREEMFRYDCIVAFDPDWRELSDEQIALLDAWVAEQGGGMIVIAGPVFAGNPIGGWVQDDRLTKIRALYPVEFQHRFSVFETTSHVSKEPWPIDFTREGMEAEFLWLEDTAPESQVAWAEFPGVYSYYPVRGPKPGATVFGRFSDPRTGEGDRRPAFLASHFFGAGRVFYLASGEMWRLRAVEPRYFETFYTKLIRHVSQGRLLRGSSRGVLLVDKDRYLLGNMVEVRAQLTNAQLEPLDAPRVALQVVEPGGAARTVVLEPDPSRLGTFAGRFPVLREGAHRLELPIPETADERLTRRIQVHVPNLEREHPQRDDALLSQLARMTGGRYYVGIEAAQGPEPLVEQIKDRTKTMILADSPDPAWEASWMQWAMIVLCGLLCAEWLIRRVFKLA